MPVPPPVSRPHIHSLPVSSPDQCRNKFPRLTPLSQSANAPSALFPSIPGACPFLTQNHAKCWHSPCYHRASENGVIKTNKTNTEETKANPRKREKLVLFSVWFSILCLCGQREGEEGGIRTWCLSFGLVLPPSFWNKCLGDKKTASGRGCGEKKISV